LRAWAWYFSARQQAVTLTATRASPTSAWQRQPACSAPVALTATLTAILTAILTAAAAAAAAAGALIGPRPRGIWRGFARWARGSWGRARTRRPRRRSSWRPWRPCRPSSPRSRSAEAVRERAACWKLRCSGRREHSSRRSSEASPAATRRCGGAFPGVHCLVGLHATRALLLTCRRACAPVGLQPPEGALMRGHLAAGFFSSASCCRL